MGKRKAKQLQLSDLSPDWAMSLLPNNIVVIHTQDMDIDRIVRDMLQVPMEKSILLDFWVGHVPGTNPAIDDDEKVELLRLQYMGYSE